MIAALTSRTTARILAALAAAAATIVWSAAARAEGPTDYCQKVTARAEGDAALLIAPTVHAQLVRFPNSGPADASGFQFGHDVQPRAAMSIGLVDIYKGFGVLDLARADCLRQQSAASLEEAVLQRADIGRLPALEKKLSFLREHLGAVEEIVRSAEDRFAAHTSTLAEVQDIRMHAFAYRGQIAQTEGEIAVLKARNAPAPTQPLGEALQSYEQRNVELENRVSHLQNLMPWKLTLTGGVAATPQVDVFGVAELSYNLGGLFQLGAERRAVAARANELKNARYEMRYTVDSMTRELRASADQARTQAKGIADELARIARDRASLDSAEAPNKHTLVATMSLQMLDLEAEQTFLTTLAEKQTSFGGKQ